MEALPTTADVVIVGGGSIGLSTAYALGLRGVSSVVLERGQIGVGASSGTACMVTPSHAERMASPTSLREGVRHLFDAEAPLKLRGRPSELAWIARFTALSQHANDHGSDNESDQVAARGANHYVETMRAIREDRYANNAHQQIQRGGQATANRTIRRAHQQHTKRLQRDRHRRKRKCKRDLRTQREEQRASDNEQGVGQKTGARDGGEAKSGCVHAEQGINLEHGSHMRFVAILQTWRSRVVRDRR